MAREIWEAIRKRLDYDNTKSPAENLHEFFSATNMLRYELVETEIDGKAMQYLDSAWRNEVSLKAITSDFQERVMERLVAISMECSREEHRGALNECKIILQSINHSYRPSFTDILVITKSQKPDEPELIVSYESLPEELKLNISRCYELFTVLYVHFKELISEEEKDLERKDSVRSTSTYEWDNDKIDFSELALSIFASGAVKPRGKRKMMESTFARELAAFFGIDKLHYDQDIASYAHKQKRKPGEFLDKCRKRFDQHLNEKIFPEKKQKSA